MKLWNFLLKSLIHSKLKQCIFICTVLFSSTLFATTHILFLGDSLSEGMGLSEEKSFPRLVERNLRAKNKDVVVTNGGVSGSTSASGLSRLKWHLKKKTDIVVLELGANDGLRGLNISTTQKNLQEIIQYAKEKKIKVLLLGLLMPPNYGNSYVRDFGNMYTNIARTEKVPMLPFLLEGVAGKREYNQADGIHPNAQGHEIIAKSVTDFVEKNL